MDIDALLDGAKTGDVGDAVLDFSDDLEARIAERGLEAVPDSAATAYLALAADDAMTSDGPALLQEHHVGEMAVDALRSLGADRLAEILDAGLAIPDGGSSLEEWARDAEFLDVLIAKWVAANAADFRTL